MQPVDERVRAFLERQHQAAMVTLRSDGTPHAVRVGVALVDVDGGPRLWSSGVPGRVRTGHLRRDPRSTLFVFDTSPRRQWQGLETTVTILDGPDAPELNVRLFQEMQKGMAPDGKLWWMDGEKTLEEFVEIMRQERRLIYEFEIHRAYGLS
jgi:PPOX class probable F420-dependent enzyme